MCGITGAVWNVPDLAIEPAVLDRMTDVLRHRGPDGRGTYRDGLDGGVGVALGHRRLSIIDVAGGKQPLSNEDGSVWITFNGEIYNYRELNDELEGRGHRFRTHCDTETIVHLYEERGVDCLSRLRGMFALAIWDRPRRRLFLARDRLGKKPLVYRQEQGRLLFASEIKSLLQAPGVPREVDLVALDEYLTYYYVPPPRTMFAGIRKLPPGHYGLWQDGEFSVDRYWKPDFDGERHWAGDELRTRLRDVLSESVGLRLRSDVPLGAFLSGGIDSTAVVGLMQQHLDRPAKTYTIGFPVREYDETAAARQAAEHLKTEHRQLQVQPDSLEILPKLVWHFDEPFGDSSAIPTYYVAQMTRQHVTVALTGDGGDELFAGYPRYQTVHGMSVFDALPGWLRRAAAGPWWDLLPGALREDSLIRRLQFRMQILREPLERRYVHWVAGFLDEQRRALYTQGFADHLDGTAPTWFLAEAMDRCRHRPAGRRAMLTDLQTYLPCDLLAKVDITSMAHGLECRCPLLDQELVELAISIPYGQLKNNGCPKPLLTSTLPEFFPPALRRRGKMGFRIPLDDWFRGRWRDWVGEVLLSPAALGRGYFRAEPLRALLDEHTSGRWNHGDRIWALLFLEFWHRMYIDSAQPLSGPPAPGEFGLENGTRMNA